MNDFVIQGVTILGVETSSKSYGPILFCVLIALIGVICLVAGISETYKEFIGLGMVVAFLGLFGAAQEFKSLQSLPEITYTVSIDDTASYNEIKNNFYYIRKLPNGLYEVKLNTQETK